jgi:hypothetical protein
MKAFEPRSASSGSKEVRMASDMNPPPKAGGGPSVLVIVLIIFGVLALICCGICGGSMLFGYRFSTEIGGAIQNQLNAIQQIQPAKEAALAAIRQDEKCQAALGANIEGSAAVYNEVGEVDTSDAPFTFELKGENEERATAHCRAKQVDAVWQVTEITVELSDGTKLRVEPLKETAPELKFDIGEMPEEPKPAPKTPPAEAPSDAPTEKGAESATPENG